MLLGRAVDDPERVRGNGGRALEQAWVVTNEDPYGNVFGNFVRPLASICLGSNGRQNDVCLWGSQESSDLRFAHVKLISIECIHPHSALHDSHLLRLLIAIQSSI